MIRECTIEELQHIADFVHTKNSDPEQSSAYCSRTYDAIYNDFSNLILSDEHMVIGSFENGQCTGVVALYVDVERNCADCIGPFADGDFHRVGKAILDYFQSVNHKGLSLNFFFDRRNTNCLSLMEMIKAEDNGNESILILKREDYCPYEGEVATEPLVSSFEQQLMDLHDSIFPDNYLSGTELLASSGKNRKIYTISGSGELFGYSVLRTPTSGTRATAEVIAVHEKHRKLGYGKALLDAVVSSAFSSGEFESLDLVVENVNHHARQLYHSVGFKLLTENCSFMLK